MLLVHRRTYLALAFSVACVSAQAQYAHFVRDTDTIQLFGDTNLGSAATYEAVIDLDTPTALGFIWNEWRSGAEDKEFLVEGPTIGGYSFPHGISGPGGGTIPMGVWTHVAYVFDGSQERVYVAGQLVASRAASGNISSAPTAAGAMGKNWGRPDVAVTSFHGYLDSFRVSDVARYSGTSFLPPTGDLGLDSSTQLLLNFDEAHDSKTLYAQGSAGIYGTLGTGNAMATSPDLVGPVPEPATVLGLACGALALLRRRKRA